MKRAGARWLLVPVALVLVAGACTGDDDSERGSGRRSSSTTTTTVPIPAGSIRLGVPEEPASLDPFDPRSRTGAGSAILGVVLPQLFQVDPKGRAVGFLVDDKTVKEEPDGLGVTFSLRTGAAWSDGNPITFEDLRFTLETVLGGAWPGPRADYQRLSTLEGEGANVLFRFDSPFPGWRRLFSGNDFVLPAARLAGKDPEAEWENGPDVAGGPFRLGSVTPGLEVVLARNDAWWGDGPRVEAVRVQVVPDGRTMEQLLDRGELDLAWPAATTHRIGRFGRLAGVKVSVAEPGGRLESLVANTETLSPERRRALFAVPDRDRFVDVLLAGEANRAASLAGPTGGSTWAEHEPNPKDRGLDRRLKATLVAPEEDPLGPLVGRLLERAVRARGATLELKYAEATKVEGSWLTLGQFDLALVDEVAWPEPCWRCWFSQAAVGRGNVSRIKGLDDLAAAADGGDGAAVAALEAALRDHSVLLPLWRPSAVIAARGVEGVAANSWSVGPFWKAEDWARTG